MLKTTTLSGIKNLIWHNIFAFISKEKTSSWKCEVCTALLNEISNTWSFLNNKKYLLNSYLCYLKHNSLTIYDLYIENLLHTMKKLAETEADKC